MTLAEAVAKRIRELCDDKKIKPNSLAHLAGIPRASVYSLVRQRGENPKLMGIMRICDVLDITLKDFFDTPYFDQLIWNIDD